MKTAQIQFNPWDKIYNFSLNEIDLAKGDYVIVETEMGMELGKVVDFEEINQEDREQREIKPILRKALPTDLETFLKKL